MSVTVPGTSETTIILPGSPPHLDSTRDTGSSDLQKRTYELANLLVSLTEGNVLKLTPGVVSSRNNNEMKRFVVRREFTNTTKGSYVKLEDETTQDIYELQPGGIITDYGSITLYNRSSQRYTTFYGYKGVEITS